MGPTEAEPPPQTMKPPHRKVLWGGSSIPYSFSTFCPKYL